MQIFCENVEIASDQVYEHLVKINVLPILVNLKVLHKMHWSGILSLTLICLRQVCSYGIYMSQAYGYFHVRTAKTQISLRIRAV